MGDDALPYRKWAEDLDRMLQQAATGANVHRIANIRGALHLMIDEFEKEIEKRSHEGDMVKEMLAKEIDIAISHFSAMKERLTGQKAGEVSSDRG